MFGQLIYTLYAGISDMFLKYHDRKSDVQEGFTHQIFLNLPTGVEKVEIYILMYIRLENPW